MNKESVLIVFAFVFMCIIFAGYLYWLILSFSKDIYFGVGKKKMFKSVHNILQSYYKQKEYDKCINEIKIAYKHIINGSDELKRYYGDIRIILEKYLVEFNSGNYKKYGLIIEDDNKIQFKGYILDLLEYYNKIFPMTILEGANNVLIEQLIEYRDDKTTDKYDKTVEKVAVEIKELKDTVYEKDKNKKRQDIIGIVGIILSVFFGIISFIQFLN